MLDKFNNKTYVLEKLCPPPGEKIYEKLKEKERLKREVQESLLHRGVKNIFEKPKETEIKTESNDNLFDAKSFFEHKENSHHANNDSVVYRSIEEHIEDDCDKQQTDRNKFEKTTKPSSTL